MRTLLFLFLSYLSAVAGDAVATFSNLRFVPLINTCSVYVDYTGDDNANASCAVRYKLSSSSTWKGGMNLWENTVSNKFCGCVVYLAANSTYDIAVDVTDADGVPATASITNQVTTWANTPTVTATVDWSNTTNSPITITSGGTGVSAMKRYGAADGATRVTVWCDNTDTTYPTVVTVAADNVVIQNVDFFGGNSRTILVNSSRTNVWIRNCTFAKYGYHINSTYYESIPDDGNNTCVLFNGSNSRGIVENCQFLAPNCGANDWDGNHPSGASAIWTSSGAGQFVFRYNLVTSTNSNYHNDCISGYQNGSINGATAKDSDIHGNIVSYCWDDAIENDGGNENIRIYGNVITNAHVALSTAYNRVGPVYVFRNIYFLQHIRTNTWSGEPLWKAGSLTYEDRKGYFLFNTTDNPSRPGQGISNSGGGTVKQRSFTNNIIQTSGTTIDNCTDSSNNADYNMYKVGATLEWPSGMDAHKVSGSAVYTNGNYGSNILGNWFLHSSSPGYHAGTAIANFGDDADGNALSDPNMGAFDERFPVLLFGPQAIEEESGTAPTITSDPSSTSKTVGQNATFTVTATGTATLSYQWKFNGSNVGTDSSSYTRSNVQLADNGGQVTVVVSNDYGSDTSAAATLTVTEAPAGGVMRANTLRVGTIRVEQ